MIVYIIVGLILLFVLCTMWGVVELEWHKWREERKWEEWAKKKGG